MPDHLLPEKCLTLEEAAQTVGATEDPENILHYHCDNGSQARQLVKLLGGELVYPADREQQKYVLYAKNGVVKCVTPDCESMGKGWLRGTRDRWYTSVGVRSDQRPATERTSKYDDSVRSTSRLGDDGTKIDGGLYLIDDQKRWHRRSTEKARLALFAEHQSDPVVKRILGDAISAPWELVTLPFGPEYPGERQWNLGAPQLRYKPEPGPHPHWDMILNHLGAELSIALAAHPWAERSGVRTGAQYLTAWPAWMIRDPFMPLPYLFFWSIEQNVGKSLYHEALAELMTKGVASADGALTNQNGFNGELANAVLAYVEEKDIRLAPGSYNRLKDWVTGRMFWVHKKGQTPYPQRNCLHFIHTANNVACPISFGDSRITMVKVKPFTGDEIPKDELLGKLRAEAPAFTYTLLNFPLPPLEGRLGLPVIATESKQAEIDESASPFIRAIVDYMSDRNHALLTTAMFEDEFGPGKWPTDLRHAKQLLQLASPYLLSKGISIEYPKQRINKHWPIEICRVTP